MKKLLKLSLILGFVVMSLNPVQAQVPQEKALLWEISGNDLKKPSYLFGTIHMMCTEDFEMPESVKDAVSKSDKLALELDMDDPEIMAKMQQSSVNPGMQNIAKNLSEKEVKLLDDYFTSNYGQGIAQIGILKPFVLSSMVIMKAAACNLVQYEMEFVKLAQQQEKELIGLETVEFQMSLFDDLDYQMQIDALVESIEDEEETKKLLHLMLEAYQSKDIVELYQQMEEYEDIEGFNEKILDARNINWIPKIEENSKSASVFYGVGAGHLAGEKGVIALLREKGYSVKPIN